MTSTVAVAGAGLAVAAGESPAAFARSFNLGSLSAALAFGTVGVVVAMRRPDHPIGRLFLALGAIFGFTLACAGYALRSQPGAARPGAGLAGWLLNWVWVPGYALMAAVLLLFPDGSLPSRRWRPLVWVIVAATTMATVTHLLLPTPFLTGTSFTNPLGWESAGEALATVDDLALSVAILALLPAAASLLVRLRRATGYERTQLRFFCLTSTAAMVGYVALGWAGVPWLAFALAWPTIALAAGVGIVRHRLFDIDVVVSRTLVVTVLAAFLALVYLAVVVGVGTLVGVRRDSPLLAIAATAAAAMAFQPVRARVRSAADRLVYGRRVSPYEALARFSEHLHDPVPATELLGELVRLLAEGTGAERTETWLRVGDRLRMTVAWPSDPPAAPAEIPDSGTDSIPAADLVQRVSDGDELLGVLTLSKRRGDTVTAGDAELAASLAGQAGLVLRNARLAAELQDSLAALHSSRQRLVTAHDEERRRLERDLHDGVQQHLLGLKAKLGAVQALVEQGRSDEVRAVVRGLHDDTDTAISELRDVARGIYPPLLAERGLVAAIRARARSAPMT
ncbi:MAG: histidine kinase, partial [Actinomycetota bacterium]|nr:histidine kinase [Actinomycetota bacterium]